MKPSDADARALRDLDVRAHVTDPARKQQFVTPMFDVIAPRYDAFTRLFSFGMDAGWKRDLLSDVERAVPANGVVLDLACGTGGIARQIAARVPSARITGIDASPRMIDAANALGGPVRFAIGDMMQLGVPDASVDLITAGYAFRNVPDARVALGECARVLTPGGELWTLDFYKPANRVWSALFAGYLQVAGDVVGWLWHRSPVVYGYLGHSVRHWVTAAQFTEMATNAGFTQRVGETLLAGGIALHRFVRAEG